MPSPSDPFNPISAAWGNYTVGDACWIISGLVEAVPNAEGYKGAPDYVEDDICEEGEFLRGFAYSSALGAAEQH